MSKCEVNTAPVEEDCGKLVAYVPCGKPAVAEVPNPNTMREFYACEEHASELEANDCPVYRFEDHP